MNKSLQGERKIDQVVHDDLIKQPKAGKPGLEQTPVEILPSTGLKEPNNKAANLVDGSVLIATRKGVVLKAKALEAVKAKINAEADVKADAEAEIKGSKIPVVLLVIPWTENLSDLGSDK